MSTDKYTRLKKSHEKELAEKQAREEAEKKKEFQGIIVPVKLLEDIMRHLQVQIPFAPHGEEKVTRKDGKIIKHHLHSTEMPFDMNHELWHKLDDLQKASPIIDLEQPPKDDPELIDPKDFEDPPSAAKRVEKGTGPVTAKQLEAAARDE